MGVVEDGRQIVQDFLAPELRAVGVRLDVIEKQLASLETNMNRQFQELRTAFEFDKRLSRIEAELAGKKSA